MALGQQRKHGLAGFHCQALVPGGRGPGALVPGGKERRRTAPAPGWVPGPGEEPAMEGFHWAAVIDKNPEALDAYISKYVPRSRIAQWMTEKEAPSTVPFLRVNDGPARKLSEGSHPRSLLEQGTKRSQSVTPHRKVSASAFESGCSSPLLGTAEDGSTTFLTIPLEAALTRASQPRLEARLADQLINTDQPLCSNTQILDSLVTDLNQDSLAFKTASFLREICASESVSVVEVRGNGQLGSGALGVQLGSVEEDCIVGSVAPGPELGEALDQVAREGRPAVYTAAKFRQMVWSDLPCLDTAQQVTVLPLPDLAGRTQGLAVISSGDGGMKDIVSNCLVKDVCALAGKCMKNAKDYHSRRMEASRVQVLLDLAKVIAEQQTTIDFTAFKILTNFLNVFECERAQVMLTRKDNPENSETIYDLEESDLKSEDFESWRKPHQNRDPTNGNILSQVANTGQTVNIPDEEEKDTSDTFRSLLCMPFRDSSNDIIGVVSLSNKKSGPFSCNDETFVQALGVFCGISLENVLNYQLAKDAEARMQVKVERLAYHMSSDHEEARHLASRDVPSSEELFHLDTFSFVDTLMEDADTLRASLRMFHDLDLVARFRLDSVTTCRWLLTVQKNYRSEVTYHNWRHGFNVAQMMFSSLLTSGWRTELDDVTCLGLLIACFCHDVDHRGTNNDFLKLVDSPLAQLYSTSTLERHHLELTQDMLEMQDHRLLENLTSEEYRETLIVIKEAILATDLKEHFKHLKSLEALAAEGPGGLDWNNSSDRSLALSGLMTGCDLGAITKDFAVQQRVAYTVAEEFWAQGDIMKELAFPVGELQDRALSYKLPEKQVGFCVFVCLPVYKALRDLNKAFKPLWEAVERNKERWGEEAAKIEEVKEDEEEESRTV